MRQALLENITVIWIYESVDSGPENLPLALRRETAL